MDLLNRLSYFVIETFQNTVNNIVDRYEDRINDCLACLTHLLKMQSLSDEVCSTIGTSVCYEFWKTLGSDKLSSFDKNFLDLCLEVFSYLLESCSQERVNEFITHMSQMEGNGRHSSRGLFLILLQLSSDGLRDDENMRWKFSNLLRTFVLSGNEEDSDSVYLEDKIEISLMKRLDQDGENEVLNICKVSFLENFDNRIGRMCFIELLQNGDPAGYYCQLISSFIKYCLKYEKLRKIWANFRFVDTTCDKCSVRIF